MNSQFNNEKRPSNKRGASVQQKKKKKTPAWKVLLTVIIMVLSVAIVLSVILSIFGVPLFGKSTKDIIAGVGEKLEPSVSDASSWKDDETGLPVLSGNRKDKVFNFLVVGLNNDTGNNTDTIMLAQYDVANQKANIVQIPRDTYINASYNFHKINSIYAVGYNYADSGLSQEGRRTEGMNELCEFIETNMAVKIDFYVLVDLDAFEEFIDSLGGLNVNVPCNMDYEDPQQDLYIHLRAGQQTLSGYDAMCLVRNRHCYADADYGRMNVQKIFVSALLKQVKENITDLSTLTSIIKIGFNNVTTNLTMENCIYFATQALKIDMSNLSMVTLPTQSVNGHIVVLETDVVNIINSYLNVYDEPITAETFDPKYRLVDRSDSDMYKAYMYWESEYEVYTADEVDENSIKLNVKVN